MAPELAAFARTWSVGRWAVTLTLPQVAPGQTRHGVFEWSPSFPSRRLTKAEMQQYRTGRDRALGELAQALGCTALLVEATS